MNTLTMADVVQTAIVIGDITKKIVIPLVDKLNDFK